MLADMDFTANKCLIIAPPTPEPETVEDVLNDLYEFNGMNENEIEDFKSRIKAAQNNQPQPPSND